MTGHNTSGDPRNPNKIIVNSNELKTISDYFEIGMARRINEPLTKNGGLQLNVGAGTYKVIHGTEPIDYPEYNADFDPLPYSDNKVDVIHAYHFLEHLKNPKWFLSEAQRVLVPGGHVNIVVPYYNTSLQASCLDHFSQFNERTWANTFNSYSYDNGTSDWSFDVHLNMILGIEERNLALFTQLVKTQ